MLKDIHYQDGFTASKMTNFVLIDPLIKEPAGHIILIEYCPTDTAYCPGSFEILLPGLIAAKGISYFWG